MRATFDSTATLRGIAISAVVINHYLNWNISGDFLGFASLWISLFFIVSGYSISISLEKLTIRDNHLEPRNLVTFYALRIIRIVPLFWIAYLVQQLLLGQQINLNSLLGLHGTGHFWFIPAILQCYVIAPLVFILLNYNRVITIGVILTLYICANVIISLELVPGPLLEHLNYLHLNWHDTYFLYLLIFSLSMLLPRCVEQWETVKRSEKRTYLAVFIALAMMYIISVKWQDRLTLMHDLFISTLVPIILISMSAIYLLFNRFYSKIFSWLGKASYSIYLFHISYFFLINLLFEYRKDSLEELIIALVLLPLFLLICRMIESFGTRLSVLFKRLIVSHPAVQQ